MVTQPGQVSVQRCPVGTDVRRGVRGDAERLALLRGQCRDRSGLPLAFVALGERAELVGGTRVKCDRRIERPSRGLRAAGVPGQSRGFVTLLPVGEVHRRFGIVSEVEQFAFQRRRLHADVRRGVRGDAEELASRRSERLNAAGGPLTVTALGERLPLVRGAWADDDRNLELAGLGERPTRVPVSRLRLSLNPELHVGRRTILGAERESAGEVRALGFDVGTLTRFNAVR